MSFVSDTSISALKRLNDHEMVFGVELIPAYLLHKLPGPVNGGYIEALMSRALLETLTYCYCKKPQKVPKCQLCSWETLSKRQRPVTLSFTFLQAANVGEAEIRVEHVKRCICNKCNSLTLKSTCYNLCIDDFGTGKCGKSTMYRCLSARRNFQCNESAGIHSDGKCDAHIQKFFG